MMVITSTGALSQTWLLSSGYNAADAFMVMMQIFLGMILFCLFLILFARVLPLKRG